MKTCRKNKKLNVVCDGGENRKEIDNCAKKVQENNTDQTKMTKDIKENQWQILATILNKWSMALYLISNIAAFLGFWAKVKDQI